MPAPTTSRLLQPSKRIELPPNCLFYIDPNLDKGRSKLTDWAGLYGVSKPRDNLLLSPAMNVDTNGDGVVDDFVSVTLSGITATYSLDQGSQKIDITASTSTNSARVHQYYEPVAPGERISVKVSMETLGDISASIQIDWYNGVTYISSTESEYDIKLENQTAPTATTRCQIKFRVQPNSIGSIGSAWFNTALLVKGSTAQQISDPHQDLTIIDAEAWGPNATIVRSLNGSSDYMYCGNHSNIDIITATPQRPLAVFSTFRADGGVGYIICKNNSAATDIQYAIQFGFIGSLRIDVYLNGADRLQSPANSIINGKWYFAGFVWDGISIKLYINNNLVATVAYSDILISRPNFRLGCRGSNGVFFKGLLGPQFITYGATLFDVKTWADKVKLLQKYGIA